MIYLMKGEVRLIEVEVYLMKGEDLSNERLLIPGKVESMGH